ncbi:MAG: integrase [Candidatus Methanoperedenaceae archaeon]|nr:MAG: integrase [Candidatus Methanoperedenaceae archaeon]
MDLCHKIYLQKSILSTMRRPIKISKLNKPNVKIIENYRRALELEQLGELTINGYLWKIYTALEHLKFKAADKITKEDIQDYLIHRRKNNKQRTINGDIIALRKFYEWLKPGNDFFTGIKVKQPKNYLPVEQLITTEDVKKLLAVCKSQRDRAILILIWDSGCRLDEILTRNINHVQFDEHGATMIVNGKTGMRKVRLIDSLPDIRLWLNQHPIKNNPDAPLFVTERRYDHKEGKVQGERRLDHNTIQNMLKKIGRLAEIDKSVHPHALRHARLTYFVKQGFMESELRILAGWTKESNMAATYIHLSGGDVDRKLLAKNGLIKDDEELLLKTLKPGKCPRCSAENPVDAKYCSICGLILDQNLSEKIQNYEKQIPQLIELLLKSDETRKLLAGIVK